MREFDEPCLTKPPEIDSDDINQIREKINAAE